MNDAQFKEVILSTIDELAADDKGKNGVVFKWRYDEKPDWEIMLGFKQDAQEGVQTHPDY